MFPALFLYHILVFLLISFSDSTEVFFTWCTSPHSSFNGNDLIISSSSSSSLLVHVSACAREEHAFRYTNMLLRAQNVSVWFYSDKLKHDYIFTKNGTPKFSDCVISAFPLNSLNTEQKVDLQVFEESGVMLMQYSFPTTDILRNISSCAQYDKVLQMTQRRPQLFASFFIGGVDTLLTVQWSEEVTNAAMSFIEKNNVDMANYDRIVNQLFSSLMDRNYRREILRLEIENLILHDLPIRIVLGASVDEVREPVANFGPLGWIPFTINDFDVLSEEDFIFYFQKPNMIDIISTEHVFEHIPVDDVLHAFALCYKYLKLGEGYLRIAVPDWWGGDNSTERKLRKDILHAHRIQFNVFSLTQFLLMSAPFLDIAWREYQYHSNEKLEAHNITHKGSLDPLAGLIRRSACFTDEYDIGKLSLVIDAIKSPGISHTGRMWRDILSTRNQHLMVDKGIMEVQKILLNILTENPCHVDALYYMGLTLLTDCEDMHSNGHSILMGNATSLIRKEVEWILSIALEIKRKSFLQRHLSIVEEETILAVLRNEAALQHELSILCT